MSFPPPVLGDHATIDRILEGKLSFSRFGDGEYRLVTGGGTRTQERNPELTKRLRQILREPDPRVCVGILPLYGDHPVAGPWVSQQATTLRYGTRSWAERYLAPDTTYGCASITRMCNWALGDREAWWRKVFELWVGRDVLLVAGSDKGMQAEPMLEGSARSATAVRLAERTNAWTRFPWLMEYCLGWAKVHPDGLVLAALGATATVLAADLGARGVQAIDIGHLPQSWAGISPKGLPEP